MIRQSCFRQYAIALCTFLGLLPAVLTAAEGSLPAVEFDGFGTLGLVYSDLDQADFTASSLKPGTAGYTHRVSGDVDSLLGAQVSVDFSDRLSGVIQVITEQNPGNNFDPHVEWANLQYYITPDVSVTVGRTVLPTFLASTFRKVGFATTWLRPPVEVYDMIPLTSSDGINLRWETQSDSLFNTLYVTYGENKSELSSGTNLDVTNGWSVADTLEVGSWTIHGSFQRAKVHIDSLAPVFEGFRQFGARGLAIAGTYDPGIKPYYYIGLGASYDPGSWFLTGELGHSFSDSLLNERLAAYLSGGLRFGDLTPYITVASVSEPQHAPPELNTDGLSPAAAQQAMTLNNLLRTDTMNRPNQVSVSAGLRWDLGNQAALVAEYGRTNIGANSSGILVNVQPGFEPGRSFNLFSIALHFVFP